VSEARKVPASLGRRLRIGAIAVLAAGAGCGAAAAVGSPAHRRPAQGGFPRSTLPPRPTTTWSPIPFGPKRKAQTVAYVRRHYGSFISHPTWRLIDPHVIVIHYTDASYRSTFDTFADDVPDSELHELPATSAHFVIDRFGHIHQLVSLGTIARHTVGLNWTAFGIEHVGFSDDQVLGDRRQMRSSLKLVHWLMCRYDIRLRDVIGHNESLSSPYHHEDVPSLRDQTHADFDHHDMDVYRARLTRLGGC
jgi:N-acetylmuramoyl-L-alanine amidase